MHPRTEPLLPIVALGIDGGARRTNDDGENRAQSKQPSNDVIALGTMIPPTPVPHDDKDCPPEPWCSVDPMAIHAKRCDWGERPLSQVTTHPTKQTTAKLHDRATSTRTTINIGRNKTVAQPSVFDDVEGRRPCQPNNSDKRMDEWGQLTEWEHLHPTWKQWRMEEFSEDES